MRTLLALLVAFAVPAVSAQDIEAEAAVVVERVEELMGESFARAPTAARADLATRRGIAAERAAARIPAGRIDARGRAWADLGLGGTDAPRSLRMALAADLEPLALDPEDGRVWLSPERLTDADFEAGERLGEAATVLMATGVRPDETLLAHALVHLRQLEREEPLDPLAETTDALLARSAWAEGEANLVAMRYLFAGMGLDDAVVESGLDPGEFLDGDLLPDALHRESGPGVQLLRFPYYEGFAEAARLWRLGGAKRLRAAAATRHTTYEILHPGMEPAREAEAWPDDPPPGLRLADSDTLGEHAIVVLVSSLTGKDNLALLAAQGWAGDRLERWEESGSAGLTRWRTRWSGEKAADDFLYGITRGLEARFPGTAPERPAPHTSLWRHGGKVWRVFRADRDIRVTVAAEALDRRLYAGPDEAARIPSRPERGEGSPR